MTRYKTFECLAERIQDNVKSPSAAAQGDPVPKPGLDLVFL